MMTVKTVLSLLLLTSILEGSLAGLSLDEQIPVAPKDERLEKKAFHHARKPVNVLDQVTDIKHSKSKYVIPKESAIKIKPQVLGNGILPTCYEPNAKKFKANTVAEQALKGKTKKKKTKAKKNKKNKSKRGQIFRNKLRKALKVLKKKAKTPPGKVQNGKGKKQRRLLRISPKKWKTGSVSKVFENLKNMRNWRKGRKFPRRRLRLLKWRKRKGKPMRKNKKGKKMNSSVTTNLKGKPKTKHSKRKTELQREKANNKGKKGQKNIMVRKGRKGNSSKGRSKKQPRNLKLGKKGRRNRKIGKANALKSVLRYLQRRNRKRKMPTGYLRRLIGIPSKKFKGKMDLKKINLKDLIQKHASKIPIAKAKNIEQKIKNIIKNTRPMKESSKKGKVQQMIKDMKVAKIQNVMTKPGAKKTLSES